MKINGIFISNQEDIDKAENLNMDIPDPKLTDLPVGFNIEDVKIYHHTTDGNMILYIGGFEPNHSWKLRKNRVLELALNSKFNDVN